MSKKPQPKAKKPAPKKSGKAAKALKSFAKAFLLTLLVVAVAAILLRALNPGQIVADLSFDAWPTFAIGLLGAALAVAFWKGGKPALVGAALAGAVLVAALVVYGDALLGALPR